MKPLCLIILDGWGIAPKSKGNAIAQAEPAHFDHYWHHYPHTMLKASGEAVGLPPKFIGNSEVGHLHIGAGRLVKQDMLRINDAIKNRSFFNNKVLRKAFMHGKKHTVHLLGLLSDGGVHSHISHIIALLDAAKKMNVPRLFVHAFLDGRDVPPKSAEKYLARLERELKKRNRFWSIGSLMGRYYAMDRDNRWNREHKAYDAMVNCNGFHYKTWQEALQAAYARGESDEFVKPSIVEGYLCHVQDHDTVMFFNFRSDRARELTRAFVQGRFNNFKRKRMMHLHFFSLTQYDSMIKTPVAFPPIAIHDTLGEVVSKKGFSQFRLAETEKYAHVTYFFNGLCECIFRGEKRLLIPSRKVTTYDKVPAMKASQIAEAAVAALKKKYSLTVINFANADMVGHTGKFDKVVEAVNQLDHALGKVVESYRRAKCTVIITADHGNAEQMLYPAGSICTAHTTNPVPFIVVGAKVKLKQGNLYQVAPTVLELMGLKKPRVMAKSLIV